MGDVSGQAVTYWELTALKPEGLTRPKPNGRLKFAVYTISYSNKGLLRPNNTMCKLAVYHKDVYHTVNTVRVQSVHSPSANSSDTQM